MLSLHALLGLWSPTGNGIQTQGRSGELGGVAFLRKLNKVFARFPKL